jgi:hypothetical protein
VKAGVSPVPSGDSPDAKKFTFGLAETEWPGFNPKRLESETIVRKTATEEAAVKPATPKTERPSSTQLRNVVFGGSHQSKGESYEENIFVICLVNNFGC